MPNFDAAMAEHLGYRDVAERGEKVTTQRDWPMCDRCEKEVKPLPGKTEACTYDIWVQGNAHYETTFNGEPEIDSKSFELEGRDYIVLCEGCWEYIYKTIWAALCVATTADHPPTDFASRLRKSIGPSDPESR